MHISKIGNCISFETDNSQMIFPLSSLFFIGNGESDDIDVRLKENKNSLLNFDYREIEGMSFASANEAIEYLGDMSNNNK